MHGLFLIALFLMSCLGSFAHAEEDVAALRSRIAELEAENGKLRGKLTALTFAQKVQGGVVADVPIDGARSVRMVVARKGWGSGRPEDVAKVCASAAETVLAAIKPEEGKEPTIYIVRDGKGPMVLSQRGPRGEFIVLLSAGERHWSQVAYQFSHELGHVLCGDLSLQMPERWFEEAFCESLSLWTMDKMGVGWQSNPPYDNWKDYAPSLASYSNDVRTRVEDPESLPTWFHEHRAYLSREAHDRDKNLIIAKQLAAEAHRNPDFYQAFYYLRQGGDAPRNSMEWLLANWREHCPEHLRFAPTTIAEWLRVTVGK